MYSDKIVDQEKRMFPSLRCTPVFIGVDCKGFLCILLQNAYKNTVFF